MKKHLLTLFLVLTSALVYAAEDGKSWQTAYEFNWETQNTVSASSSPIWFKVDITGVQKDENIMLYLNNLSSATATVTVEAFIEAGGNTSSIEDATTRQIKPSHNYAKEISRGLFGSIEAVYITVVTDEQLIFSAEPVEPGEKDPECLNATEIDLDAAINVNKDKEGWYKLDLSSVVGHADKTLKVSVRNNGSSAAIISGGVSFDCPATGLTEKKESVAANATRTYTMRRSQFQLLPADNTVYVRLSSTQNITITFQEVDATTEQTLDVDGTPTLLEAETPYTITDGNQWFKIDIRDWDVVRQLPELQIENLGAGSTKVTLDVVFQQTGGVPVSRSYTFSKGSKQEREIQRNLIESAASNAGSDSILWARVTANGSIKFTARMKQRAEGDECVKARLFNWETGALQDAQTTVWYAVSIVEAKQTTTADGRHKDIMLTVTNRSKSAAKLSAEIAFICPCNGTTKQSKTIAANNKAQKRILYSLYENTNDTIWIGLTTDQNIDIQAALVAPEEYTDPYPCDENANLTAFDWENGNDVAANTHGWISVQRADIDIENKLPVIKVTNNGTEKATITGRLAFVCEEAKQALQTKTIPLAAGQTYTKEITSDMISTLDEDVTTIYINVITDQDIHIEADMVTENEGVSCLNPIVFDWKNGNDHPGDQTLWYRVDIDTLSKVTDKDLHIVITNKSDKDGMVKAQLSYSCPVEEIAEVGDRMVGAGKDLEKIISRSAIEAVRPNFEPVYIRLTADELTHLWVELVDELEPLADTTVIDTVLCEGKVFTYNAPDGEKTVLVDHTLQWTDTIHGIKDKTRAIDSLFVYTVRPLTAPRLIEPAVLPVVNEEDMTIDFAAATTDILQKFADDANANDTVVAVENIYWLWRNDNGLFVEYKEGDIISLDEAEDSVAISYWITAGCENEVEWIGEDGDNMFVLVPLRQPKEKPIVHDTISADTTVYYLCAGDSILTLAGQVEIMSDTLLTDTITFEADTIDAANDSIHLIVDTVRYYQAYIKQTIELPNKLDVLPEAICGLALRTDSATAMLADLLSVEDDTLGMKQTAEDMWWEVQIDGEWQAVADQLMKATDTEAVVRFVVVSSCADTLQSEPIDLSIEQLTSLNMDNKVQNLAVSKYDGWLLMINHKAFRELGYDNIEEDDVRWYRVVGEADDSFDEQGPAGDDEFLHTGYYHTENEQLTGEYYALYVNQTTSTDECQAVIRTDILTSAYKPSAPQLTPSYTERGGKVVVSGLDPSATYTISMYDATGQLIEQHQVSQMINFSLTASDNAGLYMVSVQSNTNNVSLKYVVK